jgi:Asp-tRNA(Asn)/Glu-tRNA(Gln) amidotransferase A subunit family amidase
MADCRRPKTMPIPDLGDQNRRELVHTSLDRALGSASVFTRLFREEALAAAAHADVMRVSGQPVSPLAGIPLSIKDLIDVRGETTMAGSVVLEGRPPAAADAPVVARLRAAGAAIIGKTNMTEFAFSGVGINPHYGTPANPADPTRIPGGSSSGAAVSVAAGLCVAAIGSDTGGSIRIPAALCGLVGFKPTMRRVPTAGTIPLSPTLDTLGPIATSVADCLLIDSLIADEALSPLELSLEGLRFAVPEDVVMDGIDDPVARAFTSTLSKLSANGAEIIEVPMKMLADAREINRFAPIESYAWHQSLLAAEEMRYDHRVAQRMRQGAGGTADELRRLRAARSEWIVQVERAMRGFDAMLMPTVPIVAPRTEALLASDEAFFEANRLLLRNPSLINLLDGCALSLPCHRPGELPVGLSVAGAAMTDARVIAIGAAIERVLAH